MKPQEIEPPPDFAKALRASAVARQVWQKLSRSHRRAHVDAIMKARKPETRARRITEAIKMLAGTKPRRRAQKTVERRP